MSAILVIGSTNIDLVAHVEKLPRPGETVGGATFMQANGGKGANQAVAAARLGGNVAFVTALGADANGEMLLGQFAAEGIDTVGIKTTAQAPTGTALIMVSADAENTIAVAPGANNCLLCSDIDNVSELMARADYVLLQLEIPIDTVAYAIRKAHAAGKRVVLNPAPAAVVADEILREVDILTPNRTECETLSGVKITSAADAEVAARALLAKGVGAVLVTLGGEGSLLVDKSGSRHMAARNVQAVDTTAAGDVFNGALVVALSEGKTIVEAVEFATAAASIAVTRMGAQPSIPSRAEVDGIL